MGKFYTFVATVDFSPQNATNSGILSSDMVNVLHLKNYRVRFLGTETTPRWVEYPGKPLETSIYRKCDTITRSIYDKE